MSVPVALVIFNRPDTALAVFEEIRRQRPPRLFLIADGPRGKAEAHLCDEVRRVVRNVDWQCEVHEDFSNVNLGCRRRVLSGVASAFEHCEEMIVLEDDTLPDPSFFPYCEELLKRYRDYAQVMQICGASHHLPWWSRRTDYVFLRGSGSPWGWATWKRAWRLIDPEMSQWPEMRETDVLADKWRDPRIANKQMAKFERAYSGRVDAYEYAWLLTKLLHEGLSVVPTRNLVTNIGYDGRGTHTNTHQDKLGLANRPVRRMRLPMRHPSKVARNIRVESAQQRRIDIKRLGLRRYAIEELKFSLVRAMRRMIAGLQRRSAGTTGTST